jgi:hypothetical protein
MTGKDLERKVKVIEVQKIQNPKEDPEAKDWTIHHLDKMTAGILKKMRRIMMSYHQRWSRNLKEKSVLLSGKGLMDNSAQFIKSPNMALRKALSL